MGCGGSKDKEKKKQPTPKEQSVQKAPTSKNSSVNQTKDVKESVGEENVNREEIDAKGASVASAEAAGAPVEEEDTKGIRQQAIDDKRGKQSLHSCTACTITDGEVTPLFKDGLVYRIIKDGKWFIYNDTQLYDAHVDYRFGPGSDVSAGISWNTVLERTADGWTGANAVVAPYKTEPFVFGKVDDEFKVSITLVPVSEEYRTKEAEAAAKVSGKEVEAVRNLAEEGEEEEETLKKCLESNTPFVDLHFLPSEMLYRPGLDTREFPTTAAQRPSQYLPADKKDETEVFRGPVIPQSLDPGHLGDCWLTSSAAVLAEDESAIKAIFSQCKEEETKLGAYRVSVSKQGWWRTVIVDNYLPTLANRPLFARMVDDPCELWFSLFQKAYAKVHGSYASITGGDGLQLLQDFTGGPTYRFDKEWEEAVNDTEKRDALIAKLEHYSQEQFPIVLNTPGHDSTSYLGSRYASNLEEFKSTFDAKGLSLGSTYYVESLEGTGDQCFLKLRNPWVSSSRLAGVWEGEDADEVIQEACQKAAKESVVWITWKQAVDFFDGGGVLFYKKHSQPIDYRVKGEFVGVHPSAVLEITVSEPVEAAVMLSQPDKRGRSGADSAVRYAPIMVSVSRQTEDGRQRVDKNSGWDVENPTMDYNFVVSRDVALNYTFTPENGPYYVIPRIHSKGVEEGYDRPFTIGLMTAESLEGKATITVKQLEKENRVFKNIVSFDVDDCSEQETEIQIHRAFETAALTTGSTVVGGAEKSATGGDAPDNEAQSSGGVSQEEENEPPVEANADASQEERNDSEAPRELGEENNVAKSTASEQPEEQEEEKEEDPYHEIGDELAETREDEKDEKEEKVETEEDPYHEIGDEPAEKSEEKKEESPEKVDNDKDSAATGSKKDENEGKSRFDNLRVVDSDDDSDSANREL